MNQKKSIIDRAIRSYNYSTPLTVDGRLTGVKKALEIGFTKGMIVMARIKHLERRELRRNVNMSLSHVDRVEFLQLLNTCQFNMNAQSSKHNCTGIDWLTFHRPSSNGLGWVLICPDEPGNNWYIEDPILVKFLSSKFLNQPINQ